jgi:glycosyltransferase involved in cell wall biosynthesis
MRDADVVQLHSPILEAPLIALYGKLLRRPVVFTHHGDLVMPAGVFNRVVERTVTALMVRALAMSTRITVHSCDYARHSSFLSPFAKKLDCIYPPAALPAPDPSAIARQKKERGLEGRPLVGFAGRWVEEKGFDILLRAIPHVLRETPSAQFVYAGAKPDYEDFLSRCEPLLDPVRDRVTMFGLLTNPQDLANFYGGLDVFAVPSRTDCFPSTQIEAILCGTPLVTADIPGAREVVQVTGMGLLAPPVDPEGLARSIVEVIQGRSRFVRPPAQVRAIFDAGRSVAQYEELLQRLAERRPAA